MERNRPQHIALFVVAAMAAVVVAMAALIPAHASAAVTCMRYAAPYGSNHARGSAGAPFRTVQRLVGSLRPGQTGCLRTGTYGGDLTFRRGGRARAPITLTSAPGARATIAGRMWISKQASHVRVIGLQLDGRNRDHLPSPTVDSAGDQFIADNVTNYHTGICFELGSDGGYGQARHTLIEFNRIHDCGSLPATNHQHGIYVANSVGARIVRNLIYNNADRGVQLYWSAQRTTVAGNIIDRNGEGILIAGNRHASSNNNLIAGNLVTNSTIGSDVSSYWPEGRTPGTGNLVASNCIYGGKRAIDQRAGGFVTRHNLLVNPQYVNPSAGDYSLRPRSRCRLVLALTGLSRALRHRLHAQLTG